MRRSNHVPRGVPAIDFRAELASGLSPTVTCPDAHDGVGAVVAPRARRPLDGHRPRARPRRAPAAHVHLVGLGSRCSCSSRVRLLRRARARARRARPLRVAAQIVSGIGFIGGGLIFVRRDSVAPRRACGSSRREWRPAPGCRCWRSPRRAYRGHHDYPQLAGLPTVAPSPLRITYATASAARCAETPVPARPDSATTTTRAIRARPGAASVAQLGELDGVVVHRRATGPAWRGLGALDVLERCRRALRGSRWICGTDGEIVRGEYGWPPPGEERLVLGHESLGRVLEAPEGSGLRGGRPRGRHRAPARRGAVRARARRASGTSAPTASTPSAGSSSSTATARSAGAWSRSSRSGSTRGSRTSACCSSRPAWSRRRGSRSSASGRGRRSRRAACSSRAPGRSGCWRRCWPSQRGYEVHVLDQVTDGPKPELVGAARRDLPRGRRVGRRPGRHRGRGDRRAARSSPRRCAAPRATGSSA